MARTKANKTKGKLIVIDGTDGAGKTTQADLLLKTLKAQGYEAEIVSSPEYGKKSAGPLEEYLDGKYGQLNAQASSILFAVHHFDSSLRMRQLLDEGKIVIANRYVTSNAGHQGGKIEGKAERLKFFKWLNDLEYNIFGIPKPDLNIILHVPAKIGQTRTLKQRKKKDLHDTDLKHLENAEKVYLEIAQLFPNTRLVECADGEDMLTPQEVHNQVWEYVRRIALKNFPA